MAQGGKVREVPFVQIALAQRELKGEIAAVNWMLFQMAETLPVESATAKAIARRSTWLEILRLARWEGSFEIAFLLEDALQVLEADQPPGKPPLNPAAAPEEVIS